MHVYMCVLVRELARIDTHEACTHKYQTGGKTNYCGFPAVI